MAGPGALARGMRGAASPSPARPFTRAGRGVVFSRSDGTAIFVRGLGPRDGGAYLRHLLRLSANDRRRRFNGSLSDIGARRHVDGIDWKGTFMFGAFVEGRLVGAAELIELHEGRDCEIALSVEAECQNLAIGKVLLTALLVCAASAGFRTLRFQFHSGNLGMRNLARRFGASLSASSESVEAQIETSRFRRRAVRRKRPFSLISLWNLPAWA